MASTGSFNLKENDSFYREIGFNGCNWNLMHFLFQDSTMAIPAIYIVSLVVFLIVLLVIVNVLCCCGRYKSYWKNRNTGNLYLAP